MNEEKIREYAKLMEELNLTGLELGEGQDRIRLERTPAQISAQAPVYQAPAAQAQPESDFMGYAGTEEITSPMVGVFYSAPAENADAYVKVGDHVKKGDTLCIIEAMKLMNEILAEDDGIIRKVCATNGQVVEYGTTLFLIEK